MPNHLRNYIFATWQVNESVLKKMLRVENVAVVDEAVCKNTSVKTAKRQKSNSIRAFLRWKKFISGVAVAMHMSIFIPCQAKNETFLLTGRALGGPEIRQRQWFYCRSAIKKIRQRLFPKRTKRFSAIYKEIICGLYIVSL